MLISYFSLWIVAVAVLPFAVLLMVVDASNVL